MDMPLLENYTVIMLPFESNLQILWICLSSGLHNLGGNGCYWQEFGNIISCAAGIGIPCTMHILRKNFKKVNCSMWPDPSVDIWNFIFIDLYTSSKNIVKKPNQKNPSKHVPFCTAFINTNPIWPNKQPLTCPSLYFYREQGSFATL